MFEKFKKRRLVKQVKYALSQASNTSRSKKIETIGFLIDGDSFKDASFQKLFLKALNIPEEKTTTLSFVRFHKNNPTLTAEQFSNKDFSWKGIIISDKIELFIQQEFDLLVCYYEAQHDYLDVVTAKSKANFKVGLSSKSDKFFDLLVQVPYKDTKGFVNEVKKYITILGKI